MGGRSRPPRPGCARAVRRRTVRGRLGGPLALASALLSLVSGCTRRARLREAVDDQPRRLQGARRLEDGPAAGRPGPRPVVGDLRRSSAERARGARQHLEPEPRGGGGAVPAGPRARARGPRGLLSHRDARGSASRARASPRRSSSGRAAGRPPGRRRAAPRARPTRTSSWASTSRGSWTCGDGSAAPSSPTRPAPRRARETWKRRA